LSLRFETGWRSCRRRSSPERRSISIYWREEGPLLGEPYTKQLDGKLRELRFYVERDAVRVTYWIAPGRRMILLTAFRKTRMREDREVERARRALARCIAEQHTVDEGADDEWQD
jgi:hypothetical protein